jgi:formamidopyrimidine-DNA glycosylase
MPELPEVETMRRGIAAVIGASIRDVRRTRCRLKPIRVSPAIASFRRRVVGRTIHETGRVGKRVVLRLDSGDSIVLEPRMTGLVLVADPPNQEHLRLRFELEGGAAPELLYWDRRGLGSVQLYNPTQFHEKFLIGELGPDALTLTWESLRERLDRSRREIKVALLDQGAVAGIGNLYASEILHLARVHPQKRCDELSAGQWKRIHLAMLEVLNSAIQHEGSTLSDGTYRNALNQQGGYQNHHRVYDRAEDVCPNCRRGRVRRIVQAQRSTFFCPVCQK